MTCDLWFFIAMILAYHRRRKKCCEINFTLVIVLLKLKMKLVPSVLFLILYLATIHGWTAIEQTDNSKSHPGYCYSTTKGVGAMEKGEIKKKLGECVRVSCGEGGLIQYAGCGSVGAPRNCKLVVDLIKPYPDCCPQMKC